MDQLLIVDLVPLTGEFALCVEPEQLDIKREYEVEELLYIDEEGDLGMTRTVFEVEADKLNFLSL